jgi:hypothetical protein
MGGGGWVTQAMARGSERMQGRGGETCVGRGLLGEQGLSYAHRGPLQRERERERERERAREREREIVRDRCYSRAFTTCACSKLLRSR